MLPEDMHISEIKYVIHKNNPYPEGVTKVWESVRHTCELIFLASGILQVTYNDKIFTETAGAVRFMPVSKSEDRYITKFLKPGSYYFFVFTTENAPDTLLHTQVRNCEELERLFKQMWRTWTMKSEGWYHRSMGFAYEILAELSKQSYLPTKQEKLLEPAMDEIEKNLTGDIDVSHLHELCGISYTYFKQLFTRRYGLPPMRYITKLRMNIACEQLAMGQLSVTEIAEELGYSSVHYFSRLFKKELGYTAEDYRRSMLTNQNN